MYQINFPIPTFIFIILNIYIFLFSVHSCNFSIFCKICEYISLLYTFRRDRNWKWYWNWYEHTKLPLAYAFAFIFGFVNISSVFNSIHFAIGFAFCNACMWMHTDITWLPSSTCWVLLSIQLFSRIYIIWHHPYSCYLAVSTSSYNSIYILQAQLLEL